MQSERMKKLAVICWSFGLSYRGLEAILPAFGVCLSRMSAWRDVQEAAEQLRREQNWKAVRVVGIDGAWLNGTGVMVAVDLDTKQPLAIGAIVSDDLGMYRGMVEELELGHQVCHFHVRRWVGKACWELGQKLPEEWLWILEKIKTLLEELPPDAGKQLLRLYCQQLPGHRKRDQTHTAVDQLYAPC
jgi:transposase-like protein